jgi:hypothetical protein
VELGGSEANWVLFLQVVERAVQSARGLEALFDSKRCLLCLERRRLEVCHGAAGQDN